LSQTALDPVSVNSEGQYPVTNGDRLHAAKFALGLCIVLTATFLSSLGAEAQDRATPAPRAVDALYQDALPWELADDVEKMVVHRVVDGDTVHLRYPGGDWYFPTRIIGIQAPEMEGPYTNEGCYGPEAKAYLSRLMPVGSEIYVQRDRTDEDHYTRRLRHLFVVDKETGGAYLVSEILVLSGFADARSYPPDDLYDDVLQEAEDVARKERAGLWKACPADTSS